MHTACHNKSRNKGHGCSQVDYWSMQHSPQPLGYTTEDSRQPVQPVNIASNRHKLLLLPAMSKCCFAMRHTYSHLSQTRVHFHPNNGVKQVLQHRQQQSLNTQQTRSWTHIHHEASNLHLVPPVAPSVVGASSSTANGLVCAGMLYTMPLLASLLASASLVSRR